MGLEFDYKDGQTPLAEDEKEALKIKAITTQGELDEFEQLNIEKAVEWTIRPNLKPENTVAYRIRFPSRSCTNECTAMFGNGQVNLDKTDKNIGFSWTTNRY